MVFKDQWYKIARQEYTRGWGSLTVTAESYKNGETTFY